MHWGWFWLIVGGLGVGIGSVISTFGWNWQGKKEKKKYKMWWLFVTAGILVAAVGAVFTTWGWDNINKQGQKDALIFALCREVMYNGLELEMPPLTFTKEYSGERQYNLPTFETSAAQQIYESDLLQDDDLLRLCWRYRRIGNDCNEYFRMLNAKLSESIEPRVRVTSVKGINTSFQPLHIFKKRQKELMGLLKENYKQQTEAAFEWGLLEIAAGAEDN